VKIEKKLKMMSIKVRQTVLLSIKAIHGYQ